jgi:succinate-semialdehyde dehydrogenase/glutarate-semialdehyde dehydrogenase
MTFMIITLSTARQLGSSAAQRRSPAIVGTMRPGGDRERGKDVAIVSVNPATGKTIKTYDEMTPEAAGAAVAQAHETWQTWRATDFSARASLMKKAAAILRERKQDLAQLMTAEMGKTLKQGVAEADKCAWVCDYYAENAAAHLAPDVVKTEGARSYVAFEPLGVILAIMPWNFPLWQVYRFAAPALMAGNVGVLKHASNVPGCALAIEEIFVDAGFPEGALARCSSRAITSVAPSAMRTPISRVRCETAYAITP